MGVEETLSQEGFEFVELVTRQDLASKTVTYLSQCNSGKIKDFTPIPSTLVPNLRTNQLRDKCYTPGDMHEFYAFYVKKK